MPPKERKHLGAANLPPLARYKSLYRRLPLCKCSAVSFGRTRELIQLIVACIAGAMPAITYADDTPMVLPKALEWTYSLDVGGKTRLFTLPNEFAKIKALPAHQRPGVIEEIRRIEDNQAWVRQVGLDFTSAKSVLPGRLSPDYERTLGDVAASVSHADAAETNPVWRQLPILKALPPYSRIHLVLPPAAERAVRRIFAAEDLLARVDLHAIPSWSRDKGQPTKYTRSTRWIRDTVMIGNSPETGKAVVFMPLAYATTAYLRENDLSFFKKKWLKNSEIVPFPAFVRGGNVSVADNLAGERIAVLGHDEIEQNELRYKWTTSVKPPRQQVPEIVKKMAGTEKLYVLQNTTKLFHIDMAMSFIGPGLVALIAPVDQARLGNDERLVLAQHRKILSAAGFRIVDIPTTTERINNYQSPVNILPYTDRTTGRRLAIAPEFSDATILVDGRSQSLNALIRNAYSRAGLSVVWIEDRLSTELGSVHCSVLGLN